MPEDGTPWCVHQADGFRSMSTRAVDNMPFRDCAMTLMSCHRGFMM